MAMCVVSHEVEDYATWRAVYDANADMRASAGVESARVYQNADNPNMISIVAEGDRGKIEALMASPDLKDVMQNAGVKGPPQVMFVNDVT